MNDCKNELIQLGIIDEENMNCEYKYVYKIGFNDRALKRYGRCSRKTDYHNKTITYNITINKYFTECCDEEKVKNTIMHELLHTLHGCMNHGVGWKSYADILNRNGYHINRTSSYKEYNEYVSSMRNNETKYIVRCEHCNKEYRYQKASKVIKSLSNVLSRSNYICPACHRTTLKVYDAKTNKLILN